MTTPNYVEIARRVMREWAERRLEAESLESVLKGRAVELCLADGDRLFIVADEDDVAKLGEMRGSVYTAGEVRRIIQIGDASIVAEVRRLKKRFDGTVAQFRRERRDGEQTLGGKP